MTEEQLVMIERCGAAWMGLEKTAIVAGIDWIDFKKEYDGRGIVYQRYQKGSLRSELAYRESVLSLATGGSAPAQELAAKILHKHQTEEI